MGWRRWTIRFNSHLARHFLPTESVISGTESVFLHGIRVIIIEHLSSSKIYQVLDICYTSQLCTKSSENIVSRGPFFGFYISRNPWQRPRNPCLVSVHGIRAIPCSNLRILIHGFRGNIHGIRVFLPFHGIRAILCSYSRILTHGFREFFRVWKVKINVTRTALLRLLCTFCFDTYP